MNNSEKFIRDLEWACEELRDTIPAVNYGGCGFVANAFAKKLIPILGEENVKLRYTCYHRHSDNKTIKTKMLTEIKKTNFLHYITKGFLDSIQEKVMYPVNSHILCTIKYKNDWYVLEAGKFVKCLKNYEQTLSSDYFTVEELDHFLENEKFWNSCYNRIYNKTITFIVDKINTY